MRGKPSRRIPRYKEINAALADQALRLAAFIAMALCVPSLGRDGKHAACFPSEPPGTFALGSLVRDRTGPVPRSLCATARASFRPLRPTCCWPGLFFGAPHPAR